MTATNINVNGNDYPAYASLSEAEVYLAVEGSWTDAWNAASDDDKQTLLVRAFRFLSTLEWKVPISDASGDYAQALEDSNALLAAFYAGNPSAEEGSALISGSGRIASLSAGGVSISYDTGSTAKAGDTQVARSDDEVQALRLGIPFLPAYDRLKHFLKLPGDTVAGQPSAPYRSQPIVNASSTRLTTQPF